MSVEIVDAIRGIDPDVCVGVSNNDINKIHWYDGNPNDITKQQILDKLDELQIEYDAQEYARNRKEEYDALNQLELISDDAINGTTTHKDAIEVIKAKYPKPK